MATSDPFVMNRDVTRGEFDFKGEESKTLSVQHGLVLFGTNFDYSQTLCYSQDHVQCLSEATRFNCLNQGTWTPRYSLTVECVGDNVVTTAPSTTVATGTQAAVNSHGCNTVIMITNHGMSFSDPLTMHQDSYKSDEKHFYAPDERDVTLFFDESYKIWVLAEKYTLQKAFCYSSQSPDCPQQIDEMNCFDSGRWKANSKLTIS
jgi:hypothetical protein